MFELFVQEVEKDKGLSSLDSAHVPVRLLQILLQQPARLMIGNTLFWSSFDGFRCMDEQVMITGTKKYPYMNKSDVQKKKKIVV